jgi:hypothetical protein
MTLNERVIGYYFKVFTWTNHGVTYALVSSLAGSVRHACLVCHQNMADFSQFQPRAPNQSEIASLLQQGERF